MSNWEELAKKVIGLSSRLGEMMLSAGPIPELGGPAIFIGSDYSGAHAGSAYDVYAVFLIDSDGCGRLIEGRRLLDPILGTRRMSYKGLNDGKKRKALLPFLSHADGIPGICVTVAVAKSAGTLFERDTTDIDPGLLPCLAWKNSSSERALRIVHLVSFLLAGVSSSGQDVLWFTDEDEIAANDARLTLLTKLFANISSHYLLHELRHLRCGTTKCDNGSNEIEDLTAIPDLAAGAVSQLLTSIEGRVRTGVITPFSLQAKTKDVLIGRWLSNQQCNLKKIILRIEPEANSRRLNIAQMRFWEISGCRSITL